MLSAKHSFPYKTMFHNLPWSRFTDILKIVDCLYRRIDILDVCYLRDKQLSTRKLREDN